MCAKRNYSLLSAETDCTWPKINKSDLSVASVVDALENKRDPLTPFSGDEPWSSAKLSCVLQAIDNIRLWLDQTLQPSLHVMDRKDGVQCERKLYCMKYRLTEIIKTSRNIAYGSRKYEYVCRLCHRGVTITDTNCDFCLAQLSATNQTSGVLACDALEHRKIKHTYVADAELEAQNGTNSNSSSSSVSEASETSGSKTQNALPKLCIYNLQVRHAVYPPQQALQICAYEDNFDFYSMQKLAPNLYRCLLCKKYINNDVTIESHVKGHQHRAGVVNKRKVANVKNFHRVFSCLPARFQVHQVTFSPFHRIPLVNCLACAEEVHEYHLIDHLHTAKHVQRLCTKRFMRCDLYEKMIASLEVEVSEGDSSDMSSRASLSQTDQLLAATNSSKANKAEIGARPSADDTDDDLSEMSMKSHVVYNSGFSAVDSGSAGAEMETDAAAADETVVEPRNPERVLAKGSGAASVPPGKQAPAAPATSNKTAKKPEHNVVVALQAAPQDVIDGLEHRLRAHRPYLEIVNRRAQCTLCAVQFSATTLEIKRHLSTFAHMRKAQKKLGANGVRRTYYCDPCARKTHTEQSWFDHVRCSEHLKRKKEASRMDQASGVTYMEYECLTCRYVVFGSRFVVNKHVIEPLMSGSRRKKETKLPALVEKLFKNTEFFGSELARLCKDSDKVLQSIELSWKCCEAIQDALEPVFGKCKAYPFGSRVSGLGNTLSDLDVFVDTGIMYTGLLYQDADSQAGFVKHTAKALKKHKDFSDVFAIPSARTPIVQVLHRGTNLDCDLSFRHGLSVENTEFLRLCIDVQPPLKPFILMLKMWSHMCKLNERISTYALSMMSIFFFQIRGYLPSVQRIREFDSTEPQVIGGWTTFRYDRPVSELQEQMRQCDLTTRELLRAFFGHFARFKYESEVLCPLLGRTVPKLDFHEDNGQRLPPEMQEYVTKISESEQNEVFRALSAMCIQDPFDLSHNLTKACPESVVKKFAVLCGMSNAVLASN